VSTPRYSYDALNALSSGDTGHFVFLDSWTIGLLDSMLSQERPFYLWANDQNPLSESELDDLDNRLSTAQGQLMQSLVGLIMPVCTASLPPGTLLCDGSTYQREDYPNLYDALDSAYILNADEFQVPNLSERFILGAGPGHAANTTGGSFEHTQTETELAPHTHGNTPHAHSEIAATPTIVNGGLEAPASSAAPIASTTGLTSISIDSAGGGQAMDITPPYLALRYVVVAL